GGDHECPLGTRPFRAGSGAGKDSCLKASFQLHPHILVICLGCQFTRERMAFPADRWRFQRRISKVHSSRENLLRAQVGQPGGCRPVRCPSLLKLASLVDECCDPAHCEYAFAGAGGLMVPEASAATWPRAAGESATGLEDAVYSQQWEPDLGPDSTLRWKSLAPATHGLLKAL